MPTITTDRKSKPPGTQPLHTEPAAAVGIQDVDVQSVVQTLQPQPLAEHPDVYRDDDQILSADPCVTCGTETVRNTYRIQGLESRLVTCTECGTGRLHPMPSPQEISRYYPQNYYGAAQAKFEPVIEFLVRWVASRRVRSLTRGLRAGARVLDVGCGRGVLLSGLISAGYEAHGVEISRDAVAGADPRAHIRIASRLSDAAYPDDHFDLVVLWHVFEHLSDPVQTLREARRILRPGGQLVIAVPNFSSLQARVSREHWFHLDLPRHIFHFPTAALQRLLNRQGFTCRSWHHFSLRQNPFGWLQSAMNRRFRWPRNTLYKLFYHRDSSEIHPLNAMSARMMKLACYACLPWAMLVSFLTSWARSGATVHVVAEACRHPADATN